MKLEISTTNEKGHVGYTLRVEPAHGPPTSYVGLDRTELLERVFNIVYRATEP